MNDGILVLAHRHLRRRSNRRRRVPRHGLQQDRPQRNAPLLGLFGDKEAIFGIGDDDRRLVAPGILHPLQALLEETGLPHKVNELLGPRRTRLRPQTGPLTPGENDRNNG